MPNHAQSPSLKVALPRLPLLAADNRWATTWTPIIVILTLRTLENVEVERDTFHEPYVELAPIIRTTRSPTFVLHSQCQSSSVCAVDWFIALPECLSFRLQGSLNKKGSIVDGTYRHDWRSRAFRLCSKRRRGVAIRIARRLATDKINTS